MNEYKKNYKIMYFAVIAGLFAAFGSLFGKLVGVLNEASIKALSQYVPVGSENDLAYMRCLQALCFILMLVCNASVWTFYVKALQNSTSSLPATIASTATNYLTSVLLGHTLFQETSGMIWWVGSGLCIMGLALITQSGDPKNIKTK